MYNKIHNKSTTNRKAVQQLHSISQNPIACRTTNPQQIRNKSNQMAIFGDFWGPVFAASREQHISDLNSKFALGPRHV